MKSKDILDILVNDFELTLNVSSPDSLFKDKIGEDAWNELEREAIQHKNGICQGCGFNSPDKSFNELHIVSGSPDDIESYKAVVLCKTCHTLQHIDVAAKNDWIKLVNSIFNQSKLVAICRSGAGNLISKLKTREIITLNTKASEYAESIKNDSFSKRKQTKAVFGKKFPKNRLK